MVELDDIYQITDSLYIGAYWPRINFKILKRKGITAILNLMEDNLYEPDKKYSYLHLGFPDETYPSHDLLKKALDFIDVNIQTGKVLVHCAMGISRSGGIVVAWLLKKHYDWQWDDAVRFVRESRGIGPAYQIKTSILDYFEKIEGKRRE